MRCSLIFFAVLRCSGGPHVPLFSAEPSGNNRQRDIPGYLHMRRNFFLQLLPDMEEVYYNGSTSDEDERAIFITQQNGTLNTGEDSPKAGGLENEGKFY